MLKFVTVAFRLRYILPATAVGGYYSVKKKYEDVKASLPEMPDFFKDIKRSVDSIDFDSWSASLNESRRTFNDWLDEATQTIKTESNKTRLPPEQPKNWEVTKPQEPPSGKGLTGIISNTFKSVGAGDDQLESKYRRKEEELSGSRKENERLKKKLERSEKENRELRSLVRGGGGSSQVKRKLKKSPIELYSEVLDELSGYDSSYKIQDHLPKVVVVGDQSSGKTSVLEMIAGARIFPRGAGEMMTRAPVQVTLSEGPYHIAKFKDSAREYDLTRESELAELRKEIEDRMRQSVQGGKTVSNKVISLTIQRPGIQRMVLVDLPGIIGTVTNELAPDTKECIKNMVTEYMGNPNAIILCIQDGSLDAERSIFTDLVQKIDEKGRRSIFVLTKVDIAEKTHTNPSKIKKILDGELFPMKALGYYAVVAGRSGKNEDIKEIKEYEKRFFLTSSLCEKGILNRNQCGTENLSDKVSECFWEMVKSSIAQQADAYKATLLNLESEWNHLFPHMRQLTRDELFYNARNEILDEVAKLTRLSTVHLDQFISTQLWDRVKDHLINGVYFPASKDPLHFGARVDIELQRWVESLELPKLSINVGQDSLKYQFDKVQHQRSGDNSIDGAIYKDMRQAVIHEALERHQWKDQALNVLRVVQLEALSKQISLTKENWNKAIEFLQESLETLKESANQELTSLTGYSWYQRWLKWQSTTPEQQVNSIIRQELDKLTPVTRAILSETELITLKRNLESQGIEVDEATVQRLWKPYYRRSFLENEVNRAKDCSKLFYFYQNDIDSGTDCSHVIFFWRIKRMLEETARSLRRQILENESRRIEKEINEVLEDYGEDENKKVRLLSGKRVELAEEIRRVKQIQEKLEEFIKALDQDGNV